jgi:hypothetical protein
MRGLQTDQAAQAVIAGHAFVQNLRPPATTNSESTLARHCASRQRSPSFPKRSDTSSAALGMRADLAMQQRPLDHAGRAVVQYQRAVDHGGEKASDLLLGAAD